MHSVDRFLNARERGAGQLQLRAELIDRALLGIQPPPVTPTPILVLTIRWTNLGLSRDMGRHGP